MELAGFNRDWVPQPLDNEEGYKNNESRTEVDEPMFGQKAA